ncbi:MAG: alpha/beta hydrolase [Myxococcota bacterium]
MESRCAGAQGVSLFRRSWLPAGDPVRVIALVHGFAEHSARYDAVGAWLAARGIAVHAYDQRGHGRTASALGRVGPFEGLLDDLDAFLAGLEAEHPEVPRVLVGHSMGGLVVATHLRERRPEVDCAVVTGPALSISPDVTPARRRLAGLTRRLFPGLTVRVAIDPEGLCRDPDVVRRYVEDPLVFDRVEARFVAELLDAIERTAAEPGEIEVPLLVLHGEADPICRADASEGFHARLATPGSQLRIYPELRHEILNEPESEQVLRDMLDWIELTERPAHGRD